MDSRLAQFIHSTRGKVNVALVIPVQLMIQRLTLLLQSPPSDIESVGQTARPPPTSHGPPPQAQPDYKFSAMLITLCFTAALESFLLFLQLHNEHKNLIDFPLSFHLFSLAITCAFVTTFLEKFVIIPATRFATLLRKMGIAFFAAAFMLAVIIPSPMWLRIVVSAIFFFALLAVFQKYWRCS